jgi:hypothetical protein
VSFEHPDGRPVIEPDHELEDTHQLRAAERPAVAKHLVVEILNADSRVLLQDVQVIEDFLQIGKLNVPRALLSLDGHL